MVTPCGAACSEQAVVLQQCCIPGWRHVRLFPAICPTKNWNLTRFFTTYWEITSFCRFQKKSWWPGHFEKGLAKLNSFSSMPGIKGSLLRFKREIFHFTSTYSCISPQTGYSRTHTLVKSKILIVVVKRRQKGRDPGVIPLGSHPRSTLFSAQPSLTSTAKWPNYQPSALYPFKCPAPQSLTIICNCDFRLSSGEANINWAQNEISHLLYLDHDVLVFMPRDALVVWNDRNQHLQPETLVLHIVDIWVAALIEEKWLSMDI